MNRRRGRGGQGQKRGQKQKNRVSSREEGGGGFMVKESRIHLKVNRNSLAPFRETSVTLGGGGGGACCRGQRANVNVGAATHFIC